MNRRRVALMLAGLAMMAVGFGGAVTNVWADGDVAVTLSDFSIAVDPASVSAGEVTFNVMNTSAAEEHELVVVKTDVAHDAFEAKADNPNQVDEEAAGELIGEIEPEDLQPGGSSSATFNLSAGNYVLLCNVPGHYQLGMHVAFTVTEAEAAAAADEGTMETTEAPETALPTTGSGGLQGSDSGPAWGLLALAFGGFGLGLLGLTAIGSRRRA
jgi:uncharacterized cupredoxin-like copper-binding protein